MRESLQLKVHGRGNAWPVSLGQEHPFYDREDARELANAAFSLEQWKDESLLGDILVDAGHGTVQSLLAGANRIPHCICLTHGHMDHTLSVDWVVQSYRRFGGGAGPYPIYATAPVYRFLLQSFPQLAALTELRELLPGVSTALEVPGKVEVTAFPVYHGPSAAGASMLLFQTAGKKVLFTGDVLTPLLREEDYQVLRDVDLLVADANNRFPWPRTNHWSFSGRPGKPIVRCGRIDSFLEGNDPDKLCAPHEDPDMSSVTRDYLEQFKMQWNPATQPMTVLELVGRIGPSKVIPVHYSGSEDQKHYGADMLDRDALQQWMERKGRDAGFSTEFHLPLTGEILTI